MDAIEARFRDTPAAVEKLHGRGGKIIFARLVPHLRAALQM